MIKALMKNQEKIDWVSTGVKMKYFDVTYAGERRYNSEYNFKPEIGY